MRSSHSEHAAEPTRRVAVALPVPVDQLFDYALPAAWAGSVQPGCRVRVPFGGRRVTGVVVEVDPEIAAGGAEAERALRAVEAVLDAEPVISAGLLRVLALAADAALCPLGVALAAALPPGTTPRTTRAMALTERGRVAHESGAVAAPLRPVLARIAAGPVTSSALARALPRSADAVRALRRDGLVRDVEIERGGAARVRRVRVASLAAGVDLDATVTGPLARAPRQAALLRAIAEAPVETARLAREDPGAPALLRALVQRDLVRIEARETPRDVLGRPLEPAKTVTLSSEQESAIKHLADAVTHRRNDVFLLQGVTGSGKTEVYLHAVAAALAAGRQALVLVPEITLTHQIVARLRARFGDDLAVLHSGLRPGERLEQWQRLQTGGVSIAVGARSALFAPQDDLGLIVIDEEHDGAYKNDEGFRYHARELARLRAAEAGCPLVLGSATPALETRTAADRGALRRLELPRRVTGRPLPAVDLVDLEVERARVPRGRKLVLSRALRSAMSTTLSGGGQVILFLNRRGFSTQVFCFECGHAERCEHCDISLVFHARDGLLRCHYCDFRRPPPETCSGCGAGQASLLGVGTERVEEEVVRHFPDARVARLDRDTAGRRGHTESVLRGLREGRLDVLVGTQMVAKGHDLPGVQLVGVVAADLGLHVPDFRAAERTFQLLTQVAGRAGRGAAPGRVLIQTFSADHYAIAPVRSHDYEGFYARESAQRAALGYPPHGSLALLAVSGPDETAAGDTTDRLAAVAREACAGSACEVLGPAPAPIARLRDRFRFQLLLKGEETAVRAAARTLAAAAARVAPPLRASVDPAPVNML